MPVVSALVMDRRRLLVQRRTKCQLYPGLWELPGGKIDLGETVDQALARELEEEVGLIPSKSIFLTEEEHEFSDGRRVFVKYYVVRSFEGTTRARLGQEMAWLPIETALKLQLLPPDRVAITQLLRIEGRKTWDVVWERDRYARSPLRRSRARQKEARIEELGFYPHADTLDIGCGDGSLVRRLASSGHEGRIVGCDISAVAIFRGEQRHRDDESGKVCFVVADASALPFSSCSFGQVLMIGSLEHVPQPSSSLDEVGQVLTHDGMVFISTSSCSSAVYWMRRLRQFLCIWPYGLQNEFSRQSLFEALARSGLRVQAEGWAHTAFDFPFSAAFDRLVSLFKPDWGRYLFVRAGRPTVDG